mgnify:CR=1 FL=1|tara:strand:+ start:566 stop:787 length:222 start_codon:yes stop_codon:yes gene_type:complete
MEDIKTFLMEHQKYDLLAILETLLDEMGYEESDEDYEVPEQIPPEPYEEYIEGNIIDDEIDVGKTSEGFYYIK